MNPSDQCCHGRGHSVFALESTLTLGGDLSPLTMMFLPKPNGLTVDLQASLFTIWVFYPALPHNRKLILQQMKCGNGLVFMEVTGLVMFPITLEQLAWQNDGLATWSISHSTKWRTPPCRVRAMPSSMQKIHWINNQTVVLLLSYLGFTDSNLRNEVTTFVNISYLFRHSYFYYPVQSL